MILIKFVRKGIHYTWFVNENWIAIGEQEIFSFWTISKMQRLELLNHNHVHKHWKLVEALRKKKC